MEAGTMAVAGLEQSVGAKGPLDLSQFEVRAAVDFVTITTPGKRDLPNLEGRPEWVVSDNYRQLTIHDLRPGDVTGLARLFPNSTVSRIEVAVDLVPVRSVTSLHDRAMLLDQAHAWVATHLFPYHAPFMEGKTTVGFDPRTRKLCPFNHRVPRPDEQLLFGFRNDPQVKVYRKRIDNGANLDPSRHCLRTEVNLTESASHALGLRVLTDLHGFAFRRKLSGYFRMAVGPVCVPNRSKNALRKALWQRTARLMQREAEQAWEQAGVQGIVGMPDIQVKRHAIVNQRIGKALQRLQENFSREKIVLSHLVGPPIQSFLTEVYGACLAERITIKKRNRMRIPYIRPRAPEILIRL